MNPLARAAFIAVGSELLTPTRTDTNSLMVTGHLNALGIELAFKVVVGDERDELARALRYALERVDLVVCSGGLGPTDDDVTREVAAEVLGRSLSEDADIAARIESRFTTRGMRMPEINRRQAMVPGGAHVLENAAGTAPGLWLESGDKVVLLLPGPPRELGPMLVRVAAGPLSERAAGTILKRRVFRITGRTESHTEEALRPAYARWAAAVPPVAATILASLGQIELHVSARAAEAAQADASLDQAARDVQAALGLDVYGVDGESLEEVVGRLLAERGLRVAIAESCTGGLLTSRLTDVPGSSRYVVEAVVAYANEAKVSRLDVSLSTLREHGAVSEAVAVEMASGIRTRARVDLGVGVTGIAGPDGGTTEKPVGTVAVAVAAPSTTLTRTFRFVGGREQVKFQASQAAMDMVRRLLLEG